MSLSRQPHDAALPAERRGARLSSIAQKGMSGTVVNNSFITLQNNLLTSLRFPFAKIDSQFMEAGGIGTVASLLKCVIPQKIKGKANLLFCDNSLFPANKRA